MKKSIVINLYAGPGADKSTLAAELFASMKRQGASVELVREYAKELVWAGDLDTLDKQYLVTQEQCRRQAILNGKVDFIITDSPIFLGLLYGKGKPCYDDNVKTISDNLALYHNLIVKVARAKPYITEGRLQTAEEAKGMDMELDDLVFSLFGGHHIVYDNQGSMLSIIADIHFHAGDRFGEISAP